MVPSPAERDLEAHAKKLTARAVDEALPNASPELRSLAAKELAPWAEKLVKLLDEAVRIPFTNIHIGLDPIVGFLLPGAGDAITSTGSVALLFLALKERVPTIGLLRMIGNILLDGIVGALPFAGDAFDAFFRANRRNLRIIEEYRADPNRKARPIDYVLVWGGVLLAIASFLVPVLIFWGGGIAALAAAWRSLTGP
jgi:hypothetical protein